MRIIFMGTPEFAVHSLKILIDNGYNIVGVVTATDKMGGRGKKKLLKSAVKKYAETNGLNILQPKNLKAPEFIQTLKDLRADLQIVVAFRMLPEVVWNMPPMGTYNLHGSLLPKYRGAAPIHWAVIHGEQETGVTSFKLKHAIDSGDLLLQETLKIAPEETTGEVMDRLQKLGAKVILKTVETVINGNFKLQPQDLSLVSKAPKLNQHVCRIDFNLPTKKVHDFIRGLSPFPTAWCYLQGKKLKIFKARIFKDELKLHKAGSFTIFEKKLLVATKDGFIELIDIKLQGKKQMLVKDFLNGFKLEEAKPIILDLHFLDIEKTIATFLIPTQDGLVLIETGPYSTFKNLKKVIQKNGYDIRDVKHVFLSHIHFDHAGAAWALAELGAKIYLHPIGVKHMKDPTRLWESAKKIYQDKMEFLWGKMEKIEENNLIPVHHGEKFEIGGEEFETWFTPGHAIHHIAIKHNNSIFVGDVGGVKIDNGPAMPPCPPPDIHIEDWINSIQIIKDLQPNSIFLTHFGEVDHVDQHLDDLKANLLTWANWIKNNYSKDIPMDSLINNFQEMTKTQLETFGCNPQLIEKYEIANPSWMSVSGLIRYWKKVAKIWE